MAEELNEIEKALVQVRRIAEHRDEGSEKQIRKLYKECLKELQGFIGVEYAKYADDDGKLIYSALRNKSRKAKFLEEVVEHVDTLTLKVRDEIQTVIEGTYKLCYGGMVDAVMESDRTEGLRNTLKSLKGVNSQTVTQAVKNPVDKLTLNKVLERHRKDVIYKIKQDITLGITNGDLMPTAAQKVAKHLDNNYNKAVNVVRTEGHRVRETAINDAAHKSDEVLKKSKSGYRMVKTWRTMNDGAVRRPNKYNNADHTKMEGVTVLQDEKFTLCSGAKADCPGTSGVASEDCYCRCYDSQDIMTEDEFFKLTGRYFEAK